MVCIFLSIRHCVFVFSNDLLLLFFLFSGFLFYFV